MRYGIFSDIHSNLEALESVLNELSSRDIDRFFCVGDVVGYGADPVACLARVRELPAITLAGNHDWAVAGVIGTEAFNSFAREAVRLNRERLGAPEITHLATLRLTYSDAEMTFVHSTLDDPAAFNYLLTPADAGRTMDELETPVCFVGHTHEAGVFLREAPQGPVARGTEESFTLARGVRYVVNVGSVGQPRDGDPRSAFCVYDTEERRVEIARVPYDVEKARAKIINAGLPAFLGDRLLYGQ